MENQFEELIKQYEESQKILLRGLDNSLVFYIAQSVNDRPLMEYSLEKGIKNSFSNSVINTVLDAFEK
jgi:hypothetical protein